MKPAAADMIMMIDRYAGRSYEEMDCQAFVERLLKDVGIIKDLRGSNAWYRAMTWTGTPEECRATFGVIPAGAFLFILAHDGGEPEKYKADGIGNASHIGIYTGTGEGAWHSSKSRGGVCESKFSGKSIKNGWNRVGLWDELQYDFDIQGKQDQPKQTEGKGMTAKEMVTWADNGSPINLRSANSTSSYLIGKIPQGETVVAEEAGGGWSWVRWKGQAGYVMTKFLKDPNASQQESTGEMVSVQLTIEEARALVSLGVKLAGKI